MKTPRKLTEEEWNSLTPEERRQSIENLTTAIGYLEDAPDEIETGQREITREEWDALPKREKNKRIKAYAKAVADSLTFSFSEESDGDVFAEISLDFR